MYKVVLVDDEQIIVQGLMRVIPWEKYNCQVVGTASDGKEGLALIRKECPHILLTDIRMPNMDGLSMVAALKSEFPQMQISVLTAFRDFDYAQQALHLGISRFLLKPSKMDELQEAIAYMTAQLKQLPEKPQEEPVPEEVSEASDQAGSFVVRAAMTFIESHYTQRISLSNVADHVFVSQWHLSKLINKHMNQSFFDIINGFRIEKAKELLSNPALKVHTIAQQVGYGDVAHFSKNFKKAVGRSPVEYRAGLK